MIGEKEKETDKDAEMQQRLGTSQRRMHHPSLTPRRSSRLEAAAGQSDAQEGDTRSVVAEVAAVVARPHQCAAKIATDCLSAVRSGRGVARRGAILLCSLVT